MPRELSNLSLSGDCTYTLWYPIPQPMIFFSKIGVLSYDTKMSINLLLKRATSFQKILSDSMYFVLDAFCTPNIPK